MTISKESSLVSIKECASLLGYHEKHVRRLVQEGKIPAIRLKDDVCRNSWRIDLNQIQFESNIPEMVTFKPTKTQIQKEKQEVEDIISYINSL